MSSSIDVLHAPDTLRRPGPPIPSEHSLAFTRVASLAEIPEAGGFRAILGELEIGLFRVDGELFAIDNVCPHAGFPLSEGFLEGACVICPGHMWEFDVRTGLPPAVKSGAALARYPVRVEGDDVWVDPESPLGD